MPPQLVVLAIDALWAKLISVSALFWTFVVIDCHAVPSHTQSMPPVVL